MRFVFDTNVLLSATLWNTSVSRKLLSKIIENSHVIFSSPEIISEYRKVLQRDFAYNDEDADSLTSFLFSFVNMINAVDKLDVVKEDPDDNKIIECAVACGADFILTYDKHLLRLREFRGIKIVMPEHVNVV